MVQYAFLEAPLRVDSDRQLSVVYGIFPLPVDHRLRQFLIGVLEGLLECLAQTLLPLDARIGDLTDFVGTGVGPLVLVELGVEFHYLLHLVHVDEGLAHVGLAVLVDRHLEKILAAQELLVDLVEQDVLREPVGDVAHHQGGAFVQLVLHLQVFISQVGILSVFLGALHRTHLRLALAGDIGG